MGIKRDWTLEWDLEVRKSGWKENHPWTKVCSSENQRRAMMGTGIASSAESDIRMEVQTGTGVQTRVGNHQQFRSQSGKVRDGVRSRGGNNRTGND